MPVIKLRLSADQRMAAAAADVVENLRDRDPIIDWMNRLTPLRGNMKRRAEEDLLERQPKRAVPRFAPSFSSHAYPTSDGYTKSIESIQQHQFEGFEWGQNVLQPANEVVLPLGPVTAFPDLDDEEFELEPEPDDMSELEALRLLRQADKWRGYRMNRGRKARLVELEKEERSEAGRAEREASEERNSQAAEEVAAVGPAEPVTEEEEDEVVIEEEKAQEEAGEGEEEPLREEAGDGEEAVIVVIQNPAPAVLPGPFVFPHRHMTERFGMEPYTDEARLKSLGVVLHKEVVRKRSGCFW